MPLILMPGYCWAIANIKVKQTDSCEVTDITYAELLRSDHVYTQRDSPRGRPCKFCGLMTDPYLDWQIQSDPANKIDHQVSSMITHCGVIAHGQT